MNIQSNRIGRFGRSASMIASAVAVLPGSAMAQTTAKEVVNAAPADDNKVVDIVVTAQRKAENLQDVPLAITAVSGATLAQKNITDVTRLQDIAPGLSVGRSGSDARPNIRGINTEAIGANSDPRIAFYVDDVYQSRTSEGS